MAFAAFALATGCGDDGGGTIDAATVFDSGTATDAAIVDSAVAVDGALIDASAADASLADGPLLDGPLPDAVVATFALTFEGGTTYAGPHSGQSFSAAVFDTGGAGVVDMTTGTVPSGTWTFMFNGVLQSGHSYELHIWVDSNFGGGTQSVCDGSPNFNDHQWSYATGVVSADVVLNQPHNTSFTDVCSSF